MSLIPRKAVSGRKSNQPSRLKRSGPEVIKNFMLNSTSIELQMLITNKMLKNEDISCFQTLIGCIYHAYKCQNANNCCWHFNIYEHDKFCAQLSMKKVS